MFDCVHIQIRYLLVNWFLFCIGDGDNFFLHLCSHFIFSIGVRAGPPDSDIAIIFG